jgi:branched-chain amino acid aminotransferase
MQVTITTAEQLKAKPDENKLGFGTLFTDHMFNMDYSVEKGWYNPRIEPYAPLVMEPSTMVLHYGQGVFEGMKAYRNGQGEVQLFRPRENFKRLNASNRKLCIPEIDEAFALDALKQLLTVEKDWIPSAPGTSLYIRPTIIATDPFLGVRASFTYRFFIILSPVGAYYAEGFNPVKIMVTKEHVRAVRGGVGDTKTLGNYAASLLAGDKAHKAGYTQVLWLDGVEQKYVEEVGAMNIFFVIDDELITPQLSGSILPGITRDSVLALGKSWGMKVSEKKISIDRGDRRACLRAFDGNLRIRYCGRHFSGRRAEIWRNGDHCRRRGGRSPGPQVFPGHPGYSVRCHRRPPGMGGAGLRKPLWKREALEASCPPLHPGILDPLNPYLQEFT